MVVIPNDVAGYIKMRYLGGSRVCVISGSVAREKLGTCASNASPRYCCECQFEPTLREFAIAQQ